MLLNPKYTYIGLDFETTGLDPNKDEPIQIGIVQIDAYGNITKTYQSLIKPEKEIDELKHIVSFITGLSIEDLHTAPTRQTIYEDIKEFFNENTIIIGHNIKFDLEFLKTYFPNIPYCGWIDTMELAQATIHHMPSYALEVLIEYLKNNELFNHIK